MKISLLFQVFETYLLATQKAVHLSWCLNLLPASIPKAQLDVPYNMYAKAITQVLTAAGYQHVDNGQVDFEVGYGLALSADLSDSAISEKFGVSPGLHGQATLEKGSFLIYIEDSASQQRVWRGVAQGFVHDEYNNEQRVQRAINTVNHIVSRFVQAN